MSLGSTRKENLVEWDEAIQRRHYLEDSLMRGWKFLTGDIGFQTFGGKWYRCIKESRYHVIELVNMHEATGDEDQPTYHVNLQEIDLDIADLNSALSCCGWSDPPDEADPVMLVDSVSAYGQYLPMGDWNGNNYRKLLAGAKRESRRLNDPEYHWRQMHRSVNKIGSTAIEYARGDFASAILRGIARGNPEARIMGKMHGVTDEEMDTIGPEYANFNLVG